MYRVQLHYRTMRSAIWLYLYLLLNANRKTGVLYRKIETVSSSMGASRATVSRWLNVLRNAGYIETVNTGRSLTIQVKRWKALASVQSTRLQKVHDLNPRYRNHETSRRLPLGQFPEQTGRVSGFAGAANETKMQINIINELRDGGAYKSTERGFTAISVSLHQELLAQELAKELNDASGIHLYRSYAGKYPERLLRNVLAEVTSLPPERITKGRGALFNYLVQHHAKGVTENPGR